LANNEGWAKRIGIDGVALAMVVQAVLVLGLTLLFMIVYGVFATLVIVNDPTVDPQALPFLIGGVVVALGVTSLVIVAFTAPYLITAWGLRARKPWSHLAGLIVSGLSLSNFPLGVIAGIMGFIVLLDKDITAELRGTASAEPQGDDQ
jgi:hypothetical protein